jgi:hypothetical protein
MIGEKIANIYLPQSSDDWYLIGTERNLYSLRLGGFKKIADSEVNLANYSKHDLNDYFDKTIEKVYSDDEWLYIILDTGQVIVSGWLSIDQDGNPSLGLSFKDLRDYEIDFFDGDMSNIITDKNGDSIIE